MAGKTRCMMHGGKTPKGTRGNRTHGLYSRHLTADEQAQWDDISLGAVDDELRLLRVYLARCVALDAGTADLELAEVRRTSGAGGDTETTIAKRPDTSGRMNWLIGRIALLERTRSDMIVAQQQAGKDPYEQARMIREALDAMAKIENGEGA
ncbi:hypothetical protein IGS68_35090 (plasmid) [Skermanella sp. TT6]|uniref:Terminase small subunit n=2 Tax=Skermanella cutis TaxID=2775420 RepID=A0ABX7BNX4_9PROT|nr:hypothetical protein IGS68_35090 [Skermanella sp. TT6]